MNFRFKPRLLERRIYVADSVNRCSLMESAWMLQRTLGSVLPKYMFPTNGNYVCLKLFVVKPKIPSKFFSIFSWFNRRVSVSLFLPFFYVVKKVFYHTWV